MGKRTIELNALLEITQAINANMSEDDLYKVFYFSCMSLLRFGHISFYVAENDVFLEKFSQSLSFTQKELELFYKSEFNLLEVKKLSPHVEEVFPVKHKQKFLAVLFVGKQNLEESETSFSFLQTLANVVMGAVENKRLAKKAINQERQAKEAEIARKVQEQLIPDVLPNNDVLEVASVYLPHQSVGGDYFDVIPVGDDNYIFCIADVSGKGVPAALIMSNFQATLRALARMTSDVRLLVKDLNMHLLDNNSSLDHFVTCFMAYYDNKTRTLEYVNAGHNPPFFLNGSVSTELSLGCFMLGAFKEIPEIKSGKVYVPNHSKLFLFTDGISETMNASGEEYGEERLSQFLLRSMEVDLKNNLADLIVDLDDFKGKEDYRDDLTALNIKFH